MVFRGLKTVIGLCTEILKESLLISLGIFNRMVEEAILQ
jgi:hypothetical protein